MPVSDPRHWSNRPLGRPPASSGRSWIKDRTISWVLGAAKPLALYFETSHDLVAGSDKVVAWSAIADIQPGQSGARKERLLGGRHATTLGPSCAANSPIWRVAPPPIRKRNNLGRTPPALARPKPARDPRTRVGGQRKASGLPRSGLEPLALQGRAILTVVPSLDGAPRFSSQVCL